MSNNWKTGSLPKPEPKGASVADLRNSRSSRRAAVAVSILLVAATWATYWGVKDNDFVQYDDARFVTSNHYVKGGLSWESLKWAFTDLYADHWRPLTWLSHMLDCEIFGLRAGGHHLVNVAIHSLNALLLFGLLRYMTNRLWASVFVAALFALHPLHVENVAWIAARKDVLSTLFWFLTLWAYAYYARRPSFVRYSLMLLLFILGLMSKTMLVTMPVVLLLMDYWPLERFSIERWRPVTAGGVTIRTLMLEKMPLLLLAAGSAVLVIIGQKKTAMTDTASIGLLVRLTNAVASYGRYLLKMVWPTDLAVRYPLANKPPFVEAAISLVVLLVASAAVAYFGRRHRYLVTGWLWYLVTLVPVIGIIQVGEQSHADRYTYVPLTGVFIMVAWGVSAAIGDRTNLKVAATICVCVVLTVCGIWSSQTVRYWRDSITLFERAAACTPDNTRVLTFLGNEYTKKGDLAKAALVLEEAHRRSPQDPMAISAIGVLLSVQGRHQEALESFRRAVAILPQLAEAQFGLGAKLTYFGRYAEAEQHLRKAAELAIDHAGPYEYLGLVLLKTGRSDEALTVSRKAVALEPDSKIAHSVIARVLMSRGRMAEAAAELEICIRLGADASTLTDYGVCMIYAGRAADAEKAFRRAIAMKPDYAMAHFNLGVTLANLGRVLEATEAVRKAADLDPNNERTEEYLRVITGNQDETRPSN